MTTTRPYRNALSESHACGELLRDADAGRLNREIVHKFVEMDRAAALTAGKPTE
jgi:HD-GYP domain-containing protein (c-di-GMP phosphodiesterase class II)